MIGRAFFCWIFRMGGWGSIGDVVELESTKATKTHLSPNLALLPFFHKCDVVRLLFYQSFGFTLFVPNRKFSQELFIQFII